MGNVFISYSHDSQAHRELVLKFSHLLREFGIDVVMDQYEDQPPKGLQKWIDIQIKRAAFVIMICTENYWCYANGIDKNGKGKGVYFETNLIYADIYHNEEGATRFIPVLFNKSNFKYIPNPVKVLPYYCVDKEDEAEALYRRLNHQPSIPKPELGQKGKTPAKDEKAANFARRMTKLIEEFYRDYSDSSGKEFKIFTAARERLKDNFDFIEKEPIGTGTYSRVYVVHHKIFKEYHALKILDFDRILRKVNESKQVLNLKEVFEEKKERFLEKVRFFDQFRGHPNILNIVDAGVVPFEYEKDIFEIPYLLSKYIKGVSLKELVREKGSLKLENILTISEKILSALDYVCRQGYLYGNVNPQKIIIEEDGKTPILIDTALPLESDVDLTSTKSLINQDLLNVIFYLPKFIENKKEINSVTGICLFGVFLYEMLTGEVDIRSEDNFLEKLSGKLSTPGFTLKENNTRLMQEVTAIIKKAITRDPEQRYRNIKEVLDDLRKIKETAPEFKEE